MSDKSKVLIQDPHLAGKNPLENSSNNHIKSTVSPPNRQLQFFKAKTNNPNFIHP